MNFILSLIAAFINFIFPTQSILTPVTFPQPTPTFIPTPVPQATIGLVGDLGLGRHITSTARSKNDFNWSFQQISPWLVQNDLNFANLESPIIANCPPGPTGTFTFCGDQRFLPYLAKNKLIFSLANNHMFNYGSDGFIQTKNFLNNYGISYAYSPEPESEISIKDLNGITFGLLGFDFITYPNYDRQIIVDLVKKYNPQVDWLIVSLHWGNEYLPQPEKWRVDLAHLLVESGADIIHGHHPHVWQGTEEYLGKTIYYSFGNFIFDQSWSYETSHSNIVRLTLNKTQIINQEIFPITIKFNSQPALMP